MNFKLISWLLLAIKALRYTISQCLVSAVEQLLGVSDSARIDAEVILAHVLEKDRTYLFTWPEKTLEVEQYLQWQSYLSRRVCGEPIAYILGEKEFWSLSFYTDKSTLIPRPDTEVLVEKALSVLDNKPAKVLDLGTGTGAIALAIAKERPDCKIDAVDSSCDALALANRNRVRHQMENVEVFCSDWFSHVSGRYDLILSNPPYVDPGDHHLNEGDVRFEPHSALVANESGLADLRHIIFASGNYLNENASLLVEHGWAQKEAVQRLFNEARFRSFTTIKDYSGNDRVTIGRS